MTSHMQACLDKYEKVKELQRPRENALPIPTCFNRYVEISPARPNQALYYVLRHRLVTADETEGWRTEREERIHEGYISRHIIVADKR